MINCNQTLKQVQSGDIPILLIYPDKGMLASNGEQRN